MISQHDGKLSIMPTKTVLIFAQNKSKMLEISLLVYEVKIPEDLANNNKFLKTHTINKLL